MKKPRPTKRNPHKPNKRAMQAARRREQIRTRPSEFKRLSLGSFKKMEQKAIWLQRCRAQKTDPFALCKTMTELQHVFQHRWQASMSGFDELQRLAGVARERIRNYQEGIHT